MAYVTFKLTEKEMKDARFIANGMAVPVNSIRSGAGNYANVVAKKMLGKYLGVHPIVDGVRGDLSIQLPGLDVHCKQRAVPPRFNFLCTLDYQQLAKAGDLLVFASMQDEDCCHLVGWITLEAFKEHKVFQRKGAADPDDARHSFAVDCYTVRVDELRPMEKLAAFLKAGSPRAAVVEQLSML